MAVLLGCSDGAAPDGADGAAPRPTSTTSYTATPPPPRVLTYAPTFTAVYDEILRPTCAWVFCHNRPLLVEMSSRDRAYEELVGVAAEGNECVDTGLLRVAPGLPEQSLAFLKVTAPPCGDKMPPVVQDVGPTERQVAQLREWIELGALDD